MSDETIKTQGQHVAEAGDDDATSAKKKRKRFKLWQKILMIIAIVLVVLLASGGIAAVAIINTGKSELLASNDSPFAYRKLKHEGQRYVFNENMVSVVLIGNDRLGNALEGTLGQADAVMVVAYDTASGKLTLINVPRNTTMETLLTFPDGEKRTQKMMLSGVYGIAEDDEGGAEQVCRTVSQLFGNIPLENYCVLSMLCVGPLADAMGGVTLAAIDNVPIEHIVKGETYTLKSWKALRYVQYRDPTIMSSPADRMARQHQFAKAFVEQTKEAVKKDPMVLKKLYDVITDPQYMITTLDMPEVAYLATSVLQHGTADLNLVTVPYDSVYSDVLESTEYYPDENALTQLLIDTYYLPAPEEAERE